MQTNHISWPAIIRSKTVNRILTQLAICHSKVWMRIECQWWWINSNRWVILEIRPGTHQIIDFMWNLNFFIFLLQQQSQQKHDDPYNFVDDDETNSTYNNGKIQMKSHLFQYLKQCSHFAGNKQHSHDTSIYAQQHSMSPHQNLNNFGMALQQMRSNVGNTMSGYSPMNNPLSNSNESSMKNVLLPPLHGSMDSQSSMISEIAPKKRGRKKKVRNDEE